jgi:hypothetical protein
LKQPEKIEFEARAYYPLFAKVIIPSRQVS